MVEEADRVRCRGSVTMVMDLRGGHGYGVSELVRAL